jgi:hypothetical protein
MKKILFFTFFVLTTLCAIAQDGKQETESAKPTFNVTVKRDIDIAVINGKTFNNIKVEFRAAAIDADFVDGVRVIVRDNLSNKKIYSYRFWQSYLYVFSDKSIQIGKGNATTEVLCFKNYDGKWYLTIKEDGIY